MYSEAKPPAEHRPGGHNQDGKGSQNVVGTSDGGSGCASDGDAEAKLELELEQQCRRKRLLSHNQRRRQCRRPDAQRAESKAAACAGSSDEKGSDAVKE